MNLENIFEGVKKGRTTTDAILGQMNKNKFDKDEKKSRTVAADPSTFAEEMDKVKKAYKSGEVKQGAYTVGNARAVSELTSSAISSKNTKLVRAALKLAIIELPKLRARLPHKEALGRNNKNDAYFEKVKDQVAHMRSVFKKATDYLESHKDEGASQKPSIHSLTNSKKRLGGKK